MGILLRLFFVMLVISVTASCGGGGGDGKKKTSPTTECPVDDPYCNSDYAELNIKTTDNRIWLAFSEEYNTLQATPQGRLKGGIEFEDISAKNLEFWTSSNTSVATVNQDGLITAVSVGETDITYELEITQGVRQSVTKRIIVKESSANTPPVAIAGDDFQVYGGDEVNLDGAASYDLDGEIIDWYWTVKSGNLQSEDITGIKTSTPSFFAPNSKQNQQIILELTVRDNSDDSHTDSIAITVLPSSTQNAPTVTLEKPSDIIEGQSVTLVGSFDDIDETAKSCEWSWSDNADGNSSQLITEIIEPCSQKLPVLTFTPNLESVPSDVYVTLLVTDWLDQTAKMTQKFTVAEKTVETIMYKVTTSAGNGGTISPEEQDVVENKRQEFTLDPDDKNGYEIDTESVNSTCGGSLEGSIYTTNPITAPCTVSANFKLKTYEISTSVIGTGGTISLISTNPITHGNYAEVEISPSEGYELKSFSGTCGDMVQSEEASNKYLSVNPITAACNIKTEFQKKKYSITTSVSGGQFTPSSPVIEHGGQVNLELTPNTGYTIENNYQVSGLPEGSACDTGTLSYDEENNTYDYLIEDIKEECSVNVNFSLNKYPVTTSSNTGGSITLITANPISHGTKAEVDVVSIEGYHIKKVSSTCGEVEKSTELENRYITVTPVSGECKISAEFEKNKYQISTNVIGGESTPSSAEIEFQGNLNIALSPNTGYELVNNDQVSGTPANSACAKGDVSYNEDNQTYNYSISNISENCSVNVNFTKKHYKVSTNILVSGDGDPTIAGTIEYTGTKNLESIEHATSLDFNIKANNGYRIETISASDGCNSATYEGTNSTTEYTYSTGNISQNCTVTATFRLVKYHISTEITTSGDDTGGNISPESADVDHGKDYTFTINTNSGYRINNVAGCEGELIGNSYNITNLQNGCKITASFIQQHNVNATAGSNGNITPSTQKTDHEAIASVEISANTGYRIHQVSGCGISYTNTNNDLTYLSIDTTPRTESCDISASFLARTISISGSVNGFNPGEKVTLKLDHGGYSYYADSNISTGYFSFNHEIAYDNPSYVLSITELPESQGKTTQNCKIIGSDSKYETSGVVGNENLFFEITCADLSTLNDTGITTCANEEDKSLNCILTQEFFPNQDAQHGKDSIAMLNKTGSGHASFDFTKICNNGEKSGDENCYISPWYSPGTDAEDWGCTIDNRTGLIWEVKLRTESNNIRSVSNSYTWYSSDQDNNGGNLGDIGSSVSCTGFDNCNTEAYANWANNNGLCGYYSGWRVPTIDELQGIVDYGKFNPAIDTDFFPNNNSLGFWSSTSKANDPSITYVVLFQVGHIYFQGKSAKSPVRLVRTMN